jgi:predicted transcriptional regulator
MQMAEIQKQNVTVSLSTLIVQKARVLAAKRSTSMSGMLAEQIESLVNNDEAQERAAASAIARMERGLHLGGARPVSRDELHER